MILPGVGRASAEDRAVDTWRRSVNMLSRRDMRRSCFRCSRWTLARVLLDRGRHGVAEGHGGVKDHDLRMRDEAAGEHAG